MYSCAWCRVAGITSSSKTRKPARAAASASQRPSGPAPIMAIVCKRVLFRQSLGDVVYAWLGALQVVADARALLGGECRNESQHPAQGYGDIVNVVHHADGLSGKRHGGFPRKV